MSAALLNLDAIRAGNSDILPYPPSDPQQWVRHPEPEDTPA